MRRTLFSILLLIGAASSRADILDDATAFQSTLSGDHTANVRYSDALAVYLDAHGVNASVIEYNWSPIYGMQHSKHGSLVIFAFEGKLWAKDAIPGRPRWVSGKSPVDILSEYYGSDYFFEIR